MHSLVGELMPLTCEEPADVQRAFMGRMVRCFRKVVKVSRVGQRAAVHGGAGSSHFEQSQCHPGRLHVV